ncbi:MAG TPA: sulfur carrier protein ThiS [Candidatus Hydrogenedentes bacterium]|nr:sulfur carrier protein ThiS [Candidatus Hydrogenedentota bacterium]HNT87281.1 sulfur carrier protein ThiS [Candidatus Hydrogenedentota bacterium]
MTVTVNGAPREIDDHATVLDLVRDLGLSDATIVVQRNDDIVEREQFAATPLAPNDVLELVRLVGGG